MDRELALTVRMQGIDKASDKFDGIGKSAKEMAKQLKVTQGRLRELNRQQGAINRFRELKKEAEGTSQKLKEATARVAAAAAAMKRSEAPTKAMRTEFERAKKSAAGLKGSLTEQNVQLERLRRNFQAAGYSSTRLGEAERKIRMEIKKTSQELASRKDLIAKQGRGAGGGVGGGSGGIVSSDAVGAVALATTGVMVAAAKTNITAEREMAGIRIKGGMTAAQTEAMRARLGNMAPGLSSSPSQLRQSVEGLAAFGLDPRQAEAMVPALAKARVAFGGDDRLWAQGAAQSLKSMDLVRRESERGAATSRAVDMIAQSDNLGRVSASKVSEGLPGLTASWQEFEKGSRGLARVLALSQVSANTAANEEEAINNAQNLLDKLTSPEVRKRFSEHGIDMVAGLNRAVREGRDPLLELVDLTNKATGGDGQKVSELFGDVQARKALQALRQNKGEYQNFFNSILTGSAGATDRAFAIMESTTGQRLERIKGRIEGLAESAGGAMRGYSNWVLSNVEGLVSPSTIADRATRFRQQLIADYTKALGLARQRLSVESQRVGNAIADGIRTRIDGAHPRIKAAIDRLGQFMPEWLRAKLGINSPSRVFARLSEGVPEGMALGIDRGARHPLNSLKRVTTGMIAAGAAATGSAALAGGGAGAGAGAASAPVNITLNVTQLPGENGEAFARRVADLVARQQRIAGNSAYVDD